MNNLSILYFGGANPYNSKGYHWRIRNSLLAYYIAIKLQSFGAYTNV